MALGEALARGIGEQRVVTIDRRRQIEQGLQQTMDVGRGEQVAAADDVGHALRGIVDDDGEMVAGRRVLAGEDDVAEDGGLGLHAGFALAPAQASRARDRLGDVEPPCMRPAEVGVPASPARPRIGWRAVRALRRRDAGGNVAARAKAGIDEAFGLQPVQRVGVERQPLRLVEHFAVPFEAEPE